MEMYLYQNRTTGKPSSSPLSLLQLCRILCPPAPTSTSTSNGTNGPGNKNNSSIKNTCLIQANTLLLGYNPSTGQYSSEGWKAANSIEVIREACATWYYEGEGRKVMGPVTAHALALLYFQQNKHEDGNNTLIVVNEKTRVWSSDISIATSTDENASKWRSIGEIQNLQKVFDLFRESTTQKEALKISAKKETNSQMDNENNDVQDNEMDDEAKRELAAFLSSHNDASTLDDEENDEEEGFESDGGTYYMKNSKTGDWMPSKKRPSSLMNENGNAKKIQKINTLNTNPISTKKKKKKKAKFAAKNAKQWIYVTGLPLDTDEDEVAKYFSKAGILQLDPESQRPKIKLYRHKTNDDGVSNVGKLKGDASICYARAESVELALQVLDEAMFRPESKNPLSVKRAKFEQRGDTFQDTGRNKSISMAKRKVARLAALQAVGWDEGENGRITGGLKGLRIIVLKGIFSISRSQSSSSTEDENIEQLSDEALNQIEQELRSRCSSFGAVEKITIFSKNRDGVVIVKFSQPAAASEAVRSLDGTIWGKETRRVIATFWDGVTDYSVREEEKERKESEKRHEEFGEWLDNQELPEEFRLQVET